MRHSYLLILCVALTGCDTLGQYLVNDAYCSADGREMVTTSWWARVGITGKINPVSAALYCAPRALVKLN